MAQAGYTPIKLYYSATASAVPTAGNLADGELALNITDGKLFYKDNLGSVQLIASKSGASGSVTSVAFSTGTTGLTVTGSPITTSGTITLAGTLATANGGTNLTSFTANQVFYASSTSAIGQSANLTFDGTTLTAANFADSSLTSGRVVYAGASGNLTDSSNFTFDGSNLQIGSQGDLRFGDSDNSNWVAFQSPATVASNVTWTLPSTDGTNGQALTTNGTGTLSWSTVAGAPGGSNTQIQYNNAGAFAGASGLVTDGSNLTLNAQGDLRFADSDSSNWVAFQAPATIASNITWTLPNADGTSGQFLSTDGAGTLSWATASGGGGGGGTSVTVTQITATASQTTFNVTYTVGQISVYLNGALLASADYTATNGTSVVLATGAAANDIFTAVVYSTVTGLTINTASPFNTWVGSSAGAANTTGASNVAVGYQALDANTTGQFNTGIGRDALGANTTANYNTAGGYRSLFTNTTGAQNTAYGVWSLYLNTTGSDNTAVGMYAMNSNTGGSRNTALGQSALEANTTADNNVAVGYRALYLNTTGANNTAVGYGALDANTTGSGNIALGRDALGSTTTVSNNIGIGFEAGLSATAGNYTFIGYQAGKNTLDQGDVTAVGYQAATNNTTGFTLTAIGTLALRDNTTGYANTAVGQSAAQGNTTGIENTAIGRSALFANTTGSSNVAFGIRALDANTTASNNTAIGADALGANTTGTGNVALGYQAGYGLTTTNNSVLIGYQAGYSAGITQSAVVGYQAFKSATDQNTGLGFQVGLSVTSGYNNIFIGHTAGSVYTTAAYSIGIGHDTRGSATNASSELVLAAGYNASGWVGKGSDTGYIVGGSGGIYQGNNSSSWSTTSDFRLKKNIVDNNEGIDIIKQIRVRNFEYRLPEEVIDLPKHTAIQKEGIQLGVIAQELQQVCPDCVKEESTGVLSVDSDNVFWHLVNAVKQLSSQVTALQAEVNQLKGN